MITIAVGPLLWEFTSFDHWCDHAARLFRFHKVRGDDVVCLDTKGRICRIGKQFMRARDEQTFPIRVYRFDPTQGKPANEVKP